MNLGDIFNEDRRNKILIKAVDGFFGILEETLHQGRAGLAEEMSKTKTDKTETSKTAPQREVASGELG